MPKTNKTTRSNFEQVMLPSKKTKGVKSITDFLGEPTHKRLDQMIDQTIYIWKIEPQASDTYGAGFKLHFKDLPNAKDSYTAAVYGQYVVPVLDNIYEMSHKGAQITPDSPLKVTIRKAGNTYKFE